MSAVVDGPHVPISELAGLTDWIAVKKYNKLNGDPVIRETENNPTREHNLIDNIVVSLVAMKTVAA